MNPACRPAASEISSQAWFLNGETPPPSISVVPEQKKLLQAPKAPALERVALPRAPEVPGSQHIPHKGQKLAVIGLVVFTALVCRPTWIDLGLDLVVAACIFLFVP